MVDHGWCGRAMSADTSPGDRTEASGLYNLVMEELAVSRARDHLGDAVNHVQYGGEMVYLTRHGRRVAALVPVEVLEALQAEEDAVDVAAALAALADDGPDISLEDFRAQLGPSPRSH